MSVLYERVEACANAYIGAQWWTADFSRQHPALSLLLQAVNDTPMFASPEMAEELYRQVRPVEFADGAVCNEVRFAQAAFAALQQDHDELQLATKIMTEYDWHELDYLLAGLPRVSRL